jgi:hypothetical protein
MKVILYDMGWPAVMEAFAEGVRRFGHTTQLAETKDYKGPTDHDIVVTIEWSNNIAQIHRDQHAQGRLTLAIHDAYVQRRGPNRYYSVARNCAHAYGEHVPMDADLPDRWNALKTKLVPWRKDGTHIVVADQVAGKSVCDGGAVRPPWFRYVMSVLHRVTKRPVRFRTHQGQDNPENRFEAYRKAWLESGGPGKQLVYSQGNRSRLIDDLKGAWALVTYDSTAAVESVLNGVPVYTGGLSLADPVGNKDLMRIERPVTPDRVRWANWLAYAQWTEAEMRLGLPWKWLVEKWGKL